MPPQRTALPGEINYGLVDRWTVGHLGVGTWMGLLKLPWWGALLVSVGWEIVERPLKDRLFWKMTGATQDTLPNAVADVVATMLGWGIMRALPPQKRLGDMLPGGYAAGKKPSDFNRRQLTAGKQIEMEHTRDARIAQEIAMDHLTEDPRYYSKLCKIWPRERGCQVFS